ncbi:MAG: patatin-like phospholipase family protein [Actinobacteria bacterium]|nr:patatin-like phospholipase family protein [Actinomycetota bacterium]
MAALPFSRNNGGQGRAEPRPQPALRSPEMAAGTAFVLSGGGNQGVAEVGMLQALLERGIVPNVIVGTSAGAINGAAVAADPTTGGVERLAEVWRGIRTEDIFPGGRLARAWNVLRRSDHLFASDGLAAVIDLLPVDDFHDLVIPLRVVVTDFDTGEELVIAAGPVKPAILASTALPGVFPPVRLGGRTLIDGGVVNNVPLRHALSGPVDRIYVLNVTGAVADAPPRYPLDVTLRAFAIARNRRYQIDREHAPGYVDIIELPRPDDGRSIFDFTGADTIIEEAYALAARHLDALDRKIDPADEPGRRRWLRVFRRAEVAQPVTSARPSQSRSRFPDLWTLTRAGVPRQLTKGEWGCNDSR